MRSQKLVRRLLFAALAPFIAAVMVVCVERDAAAQSNTGIIRGVVKDSSGGVLPAATVVGHHPASGGVVERVADSNGRFLLPELRLGEWEVTAVLAGFVTPRRQLVDVEAGRTVDVDFTLRVEGVTEQVTVAGRPGLLQLANAEISDIVEGRRVVQTPLNGRNVLALAQLSDAVVMPPGGTRGEALQQAGPLPNVGGQRSGHNIYLLDGTKVTDELFNNLVISPSVESIDEMKIQKSMYPAEFGGKASALINVITKAGGNAIRGSGFWFGRHDRFDARNYFDRLDQPKPRLRQNQFGGAAGGPIAKNRSFFFGSYEGQRADRAITRTFSVPSAAVRGGDFRGQSTLCDPLAPAGPTGGCTPFAGNVIPANRIDPIAAALLREVPMPTSDAALQNLTAAEPSTRNVNQFSLRLDHRVRGADQLFARFSSFDAAERQPFGSSALQEALVPGFGRTLGTRTRNVGVSHTKIWGSAVLNELRFGWLGVEGGQTSVNRGRDFAGDVGLLGVTRDPRDVGFPQISTRGVYSTIGDPTSFTFRDNQHIEIYDNVTLDRGAHRVKFGGYLFHLRMRPEQPDNARGAFTFSGQFTGSPFADFLLGYPSSAVSGIGRGDEDGRTNWLHLYVQDDWRVRDRLTVNAGLRYEFNQHMYDVGNRLSTVDLSVPGGRFVIASDDAGRINPQAEALLPLIPIPYTTSQAAGWGRGLLDPSAVRLAPRLGFALSLDDARAVVRGGYGLFLNQWAYSVQTAFARNLPFFYTRQVDVAVDQRTPTFATQDILASGGTALTGASIMDHDYSVEYTQTWSGGVQYELSRSMMAEVSYMGSLTLGADNATIRNVPEPGPGAIDARRPIPQISRLNAIRFDGRSIYHALTFKTDRRLFNGVAVGASYTLSTSEDDASSPGATESEANVPQDVRNIFSPDGEWAHSSFDHRHQFIASATYELPRFAGAGAWRPLLEGWRVNAVVLAQSGAPFTVNLGTDQANVGAGPAQRPDQIRDPNLPSSERTPERWFDAGAFTLPARFSFGTARRNSVLGPGLVNVDASLAKTVMLPAGSMLELRLEVFNALNRANFDLPNRVFGNLNFGRIFSAKAARELQFGMRLAF